MAVCSWGSERSRFVVFAILGLRCTDCSTAVFFLATENFFHENSHVAFFFWLGTEREHNFEFCHDEAGARETPPTLFLRDFQDGCIDKRRLKVSDRIDQNRPDASRIVRSPDATGPAVRPGLGTLARCARVPECAPRRSLGVPPPRSGHRIITR